MKLEKIHPDEALRLVLEAAARAPLPAERLPLAACLGRALPAALPSTLDQPPFDKSAMDGFAFDAGRPAAGYRVVSLAPAGGAPVRPLGPGEAARIMTGAPLPAGATAVQRLEWSEEAGRDAEGTVLVRFTRPETASNVIRRGENLRAGEALLGPRVLAPQDLGILASSGYAELEVARRPLVGVVSTGDELRSPGLPLGPSSIYDSNGPQLCAQAAAAGAEPRFYGLVPDREVELAVVLGQALRDCDLVLVSGAVSMGDFDYVPRTLEALGVETVFHQLAMRPGKPTFFGTRGGTAVFGLPGNPVSTFVNFEVLVKPYLLARMGLAREPRLLRLRLAEDLTRRGADRVEFLPARLELPAPGESAGMLAREPQSMLASEPQFMLASEPQFMLARPLRYHGSSMLNVLAEADLLLRMEIGVERIGKGEAIDARLLRP